MKPCLLHKRMWGNYYADGLVLALIMRIELGDLRQLLKGKHLPLANEPLLAAMITQQLFVADSSQGDHKLSSCIDRL